MRRCSHCGKPLAGHRIDVRYCSDRCRVAAHRAQRARDPEDGHARVSARGEASEAAPDALVTARSRNGARWDDQDCDVSLLTACAGALA